MLKTVTLIALLSVMIALVSSQDEVKADSGPEFGCYVCNSIDDSSCAGVNGKYSGEEKHKQICSSGTKNCRIITQNVEGEKSIIRQCANELYKKDYVGCYKTAGKSTQNVCTCNTQFCNSAFTIKSSILAIALSSMIASLFF